MRPDHSAARAPAEDPRPGSASALPQRYPQRGQEQDNRTGRRQERVPADHRPAGRPDLPAPTQGAAGVDGKLTALAVTSVKPLRT
jgi:hypothetical protein